MRFRPYEQAKHIWLKETTARSFEEELRGYLSNGYVYSTSTCFLMGREVDSSWPYEALTDPSLSVTVTEGDTWWIGAAAGHIPEFILKHQPFHMRYYGWERRDRGHKIYMAQKVWTKLGIHEKAFARFSGKISEKKT